MRNRLPRVALIFALQVLLSIPSSNAMDMPHYDVYSLVYMSTDIVIVNLTEDAKHQFTATVSETLYGRLNQNDKVDALTPFLTYFRPMEGGMRVILFLDRRPHQYDFLHSDATKAPFAIPPSGVYLIDSYEHVHEYFQENNPGMYVAQYFRYFGEQSQPTKDQDLRLPSLDEVRNKIAVAIRAVDQVRPLLDRVATPADISALMALADATSASTNECGLRMAPAISARALDQLRSLNDPAISLRAYSTTGVADAYGPTFVGRKNISRDKNFESERIRFLIQTISDKKQDAGLREAAVKILEGLAQFHSGPYKRQSRYLPIDNNNWLASFATEIQKTSKAIFDRTSEDAHLRSLCLNFLPLDRPDIIADAKHVYKHTSSAELRFAIEKAFIEVNDSLYASLTPPGGPVASRISGASMSGCFMKDHPEPVFRLEYSERDDFKHGSPDFIYPRPAITNLRTGQHFTIERYNVVQGWSGVAAGESEFQLDSLPSVPEGEYSLALEYSRNNKIVSRGYGQVIYVRKSEKGREVSMTKVGGRN